MSTTTIKARIQYEIDASHPDVEYVRGGWYDGMVFTYEDTYYFNNDVWDDVKAMKRHIERDLRLVAGGGYDDAHVHNVKLTMVEA